MIANVGDSRAVLATTRDDGTLVPLQLTVDFKPNLPGQTTDLMFLRIGHSLRFSINMCNVNGNLQRRLRG